METSSQIVNKVESKKQTLERIANFISEADSKISSILTSFGWTRENILESEANRPLNTPNDEKRAKLEEKFLPSFVGPDSASTIQMDNIKQAEAILEDFYQNPSLELGVPLDQICDRAPPTNLADFQINFTREERLSIYRHAARNTRRVPDVEDIKISYQKSSTTGQKATATLAQIAAYERDARRRNPKHRVAKNPLTYTEEVRHLIHIQTEALVQHLQQTKSPSRSEVKREPKRHRRSCSKSSDETQSRRKKKKRNRSRSRSKDKPRKRSPSSERKHKKKAKKHKKHDR
ncbi:pre-mRNA-splicing factor CWC22 homolog [Anopheles bellator]|uniref:pre-mRNA-splicing factor CWC22 homolog n=1 Tax=Anopheles bellator TaxID=139047 RepID=UPI00264956E2|nr:pre-mRNA-splicing factor CWC22 homolog [Anopheles bellator]